MSALPLPILTAPVRSSLAFSSSNILFPRFSIRAKNFSSRSVFCQTSNGTNPVSETISAVSTISVDNSVEDEFTAFEIRARNRIGLLQVITRVFKVLGLRIDKATVEFEGEYFTKKFFVSDSHGNKIENLESIDRIKKALMEAIDGDDLTITAGPATRGIVVRKPGFLFTSGDRTAKAERMFEMMDGFLKNDPLSLQKDILDHVEYTVARSRFSFDDFEAYQVMSLFDFKFPNK